MLLEQRPALTLGHSTPDAELDPIVQSVGATLGDHRAVPADHGGFALSGAADEQLVRVRLATPGLRNPGNTRFRLRALHNGGGCRIDGGRASGGLIT